MSPRDAVRRERVAHHGHAIAAGLVTKPDDQWLPGFLREALETPVGGRLLDVFNEI